MREIKGTSKNYTKMQVQIWPFAVQRRKVFVISQEPLNRKISTIMMNASTGRNVADKRRHML